MSRPFDFSQLPSDGVVILPELPPAPAIGDALTVDSITGGRVQLVFAPATGGATGDFLPLAGGTLTGPLLLHDSPSLALGAATKAYVDGQISATVGSIGASYLLLTGGTLTGPLLLATSTPTAVLEATSKGYVDDQIATIATASITTLGYNVIANVSPADPGPGNIRFNTLQQYDATQLYIDSRSSDGVDWTLFIKAQQTGAKIVIQLKTDSTKVCRFLTTGAVVDNAGWLTIPVTFVGAGGYMGMPFAGGNNVIVAFLGIGSQQFVPIQQARNYARLQAQWQNAATVSDDTVWWWDMPYAGTINTLKYFTGNGSFAVTYRINGVPVTGLSAVAVSSSTPATATATAANTFAAGDNVSVVITGSTGSPTDALLSLAVTWS